MGDSKRFALITVVREKDGLLKSASLFQVAKGFVRLIYTYFWSTLMAVNLQHYPKDIPIRSNAARVLSTRSKAPYFSCVQRSRKWKSKISTPGNHYPPSKSNKLSSKLGAATVYRKHPSLQFIWKNKKN